MMAPINNSRINELGIDIRHFELTFRFVLSLLQNKNTPAYQYKGKKCPDTCQR